MILLERVIDIQLAAGFYVHYSISELIFALLAFFFSCYFLVHSATCLKKSELL